MSEYQNRRIRANQMRIGKMVNCLKEMNHPEADEYLKKLVNDFGDYYDFAEGESDLPMKKVISDKVFG